MQADKCVLVGSSEAGVRVKIQDKKGLLEFHSRSWRDNTCSFLSTVSKDWGRHGVQSPCYESQKLPPTPLRAVPVPRRVEVEEELV